MIEKLQEWIEAVERAARRKQQRADYILDAAAKYPTNTIGRGKQQAIDDAARLTELAAYLRDGGWLPIESAPKDGTRVLLCDNRFKDSYLIATWHPHLNVWAGNPNSKGRFALWDDATHYRPLPAPPAALAMPGGEG